MNPKKSEFSSVISEVLNTSEGRASLASLAAIINAPLRQRRNYSELAENLFEVKPLCRVCHEFTLDSKIYDENFNLLYDGYSSDVEQQMHVCIKCGQDTKTRLKLVQELPQDELPLYINDDNIFVSKRAKDRLKENT